MDLTTRVTRRFVAETLTRPWLMAVKRGWASLMKPTVHDYSDVFKAIDKLLMFTQNLQDQVLNVRRGPYSSPSSMSQRKELDEAFAALVEAIKDGRGKARHWYESYERIGMAGMDPSARQNGEHMLKLYSTDFDAAMTFAKSSRGKHRNASLTELVDDIVKILYADADRIKKHDEANPGVELDVKETAFKEFQIGNLKAVVTDTKTNGSAILKYVHLLKSAYQLLKQKGFEKVWYGVLLITLGEYEQLSPEQKKQYENAGYADMDGRAGTYHSGEDLVKLTAPPSAHFVDTVIHEMGHRYWFKFMTAAKRARFESLIEGDWSKVHAILLNHQRLTPTELPYFQDLYNELESGRDLAVDEKKKVADKFKELGIPGGVPLVSDYAQSRPTEAFAEVFERYVSGSELTRPQVESFHSVLAFDPALEWKTDALINLL